MSISCARVLGMSSARAIFGRTWQASAHAGVLRPFCTHGGQTTPHMQGTHAAAWDPMIMRHTITSVLCTGKVATVSTGKRVGTRGSNLRVLG